LTRWVRSYIEDGSVNLDGHEAELRPILDGLLPPGGVLVDIGANIGLWTCLLGPKASRVIAVEPSEPTAAMLRDNIALNGLTGKVDVLEVAAWDSDEPLDFENPSRTGEPVSGLMRTVPGAGGMIRGTRLDDALPADLDRIDLVKVDTEGADIRALRGMSGHIARFRPVLFVESHHLPPYSYYGLDDLEDFITGIGYEREVVRWVTQYHLLCRPAGAPGE
jgi:FkbM family methyltransferase